MKPEDKFINPEQPVKFDITKPVDLLNRDGDPRKTKYFSRLILNTRGYWHKFAGKNEDMYSPSIFRLLKAEGLLDKKEDGTRIHGAPEHIAAVMAGCTALSQLLEEKTGLTENDINDLQLAAAVHDANKDIEMNAVKMTIEDKKPVMDKRDMTLPARSANKN
jgi:hypothetical protein